MPASNLGGSKKAVVILGSDLYVTGGVSKRTI
jgi:hypothetical protein